MNNEKLNEITLHLDDIHDLFTIPTSDPFSEKVRFVSGIDFIKTKIKPQLLRQGGRIRTTIFLPKESKESIEPDLAEKTQAAVKRYCQFKIQQNAHAVGTLQWGALKALLVGIMFLTGGLLLSEFVDTSVFLPRFLNTLLSDGFDIAFWVILWRPVDFFLFDLTTYRREDQIYKHIMNMEIIIAEDMKSACA